LPRKIFVLDTSVLLYDKNSIEAFSGNNIVLPMPVLEELDRFKEKPGVVGEAARYVNRFLDSLRDIEYDKKGWKYVEDHDIKIAFDITSLGASEKIDLDISRNDNKILACALRLKQKNPKKSVSLITKDINLRVKCDALGVWAEDYYKDHIAPELGKYKGYVKLEAEKSIIDEFYSNGEIASEVLEDLTKEIIYENSYVVVKDPISNASLIGISKGQKIIPINHSFINNEIKIEPRDVEQKFAINALLDSEIPLVTMTGLAGSGKTFLALMAAISKTTYGVFAEQFDKMAEDKSVPFAKWPRKRIVITRPLQQVGTRDLGYLPGTLHDKMAPWLAPISDNLRQAFEDASIFDSMIESGQIEVAPIPYIRGRTFADSIVIVDEAQNATIHELKTIITRIGKNSKIILLGDIDQIDTPYIDKRSNGLSIVIDKFKDSSLAAHIHLRKGQRSKLATEASNIL
jgi:PhoH-like ATPase